MRYCLFILADRNSAFHALPVLIRRNNIPNIPLVFHHKGIASCPLRILFFLLPVVFLRVPRLRFFRISLCRFLPIPRLCFFRTGCFLNINDFFYINIFVQKSLQGILVPCQFFYFHTDIVHFRLHLYMPDFPFFPLKLILMELISFEDQSCCQHNGQHSNHKKQYFVHCMSISFHNLLPPYLYSYLY